MPRKDKAARREYDAAYRRAHPERDIRYKATWFATEHGRQKHREAAARHRRRYPLKIAARNAVNAALLSGRLSRQPCQVCGGVEVEAHHDDYSKPLEVVWLCRRHHKEVSQ